MTNSCQYEDDTHLCEPNEVTRVALQESRFHVNVCSFKNIDEMFQELDIESCQQKPDTHSHHSI